MDIADLKIPQFTPARYLSPLLKSTRFGGLQQFVNENSRVQYCVSTEIPDEASSRSFERAGPRREIFFDPGKTRAAIVTCGGLCPGLNDVIRGLVMTLHFWYGVREVLGVRYGYAGLVPDSDFPPITLTPECVENIHRQGGTVLGSSRGRQDEKAMVDNLERLGIDILFTIGGDGTFRGTHAIAEEVARRGRPISIVGIPKTIDNDINMVYRCFGFKTAVEEAQRVLNAAHVEAKGALNCIGLVRLMGRESGFIAAHATLASGNVNYCLVPEIPFALEGSGGFLADLRERLRTRRHAVIAVAEGAGRELIGVSDERDGSGNVKFKDIGEFLKKEILRAAADWGMPVNIRYFDPSYLIRSVPSNSDDSIFCSDLARYAAHAAMAGKTDMFVGHWHGVFTHVPLTAAAGRRRIEPTSELWRNVLATTGQPVRFE